MLQRKNNFCKLLFFIAPLFFIACNTSRYREYDAIEIEQIRERTLIASQEILGKDEYFAIYQMASDSIRSWIENELGLWKYYGNPIEYQLDTVFCVNNAGNKIRFSILRSDKRSNAVLDCITYLYGVKINNSWYFFKGPTMILQREKYKKDIHIPLSFDKLKQIATYNIYRGYLIQNRQGEWEINDNFFSTFERDAYNYPFTTLEAWEESWLKLNKENWQRR